MTWGLGPQTRFLDLRMIWPAWLNDHGGKTLRSQIPLPLLVIDAIPHLAQVFRLGTLVTFIIAVFRLLLDLNTEVIDFIHDRPKSLSPQIPRARLEPGAPILKTCARFDLSALLPSNSMRTLGFEQDTFIETQIFESLRRTPLPIAIGIAGRSQDEAQRSRGGRGHLGG